MKNKDYYLEGALPVYEVTELTMEEALFALSGRKDNKISSGILSGEVLNKYYQKHSTRELKH